MLKRQRAPITDGAWQQIDEQARNTPHATLSARKVVNVEGSGGWDSTGIPIGRPELPAGKPRCGIEHGVRRVQSLIGTRSCFNLEIWELGNVTRGALDIDFSALKKAVWGANLFEELVIITDWPPAESRDSHRQAPAIRSHGRGGRDGGGILGVTRLLAGSVEGPCALVAGPSPWRQLSGCVRGYPIRKHHEDILIGPLVIGPFVEDACQISMHEGEPKLILGQDLSVGCLSHDSRTVHSSFTESFTFQVLDPSVVVCLQATWHDLAVEPSMKTTPFDPARHLAPIPFSEPLCRKALALKEAGLDWEPQVGCFVWDPDESVPAPSPFGLRVYFVLNLNRFLQFYRDLEELKKRLVWLPTWHQAGLLLARLGVEGAGSLQRVHEQPAGSEAAFLELYEVLRQALSRRHEGA